VGRRGLLSADNAIAVGVNWIERISSLVLSILRDVSLALYDGLSAYPAGSVARIRCSVVVVGVPSSIVNGRARRPDLIHMRVSQDARGEREDEESGASGNSHRSGHGSIEF
jgi:hypothetical protein